MSIRRFPYRKGAAIALLTAAVALPMAGTAWAKEDQAVPPRMEYNVILVFLDALRADHVGAYGYGRDTTPNLDRLAREGILFENHFTPYTITIGSFMSMITGVYPDSHGVRYVAKDVLPAKIKTLAEVLEANGYFTAWYGPNEDPHLAFEVGFGRGFKTFDIFPEDLQAGKSLLDAFLETNKGRKFFLNFHTYNLHAPYFPAKKYKERFHSGPSRNGVFEDSESLDKATIDVIRNALGTKDRNIFKRIRDAFEQKNEVRRVMGDDMLAEIAAKGLLDAEYPTSKDNLYNYLREKQRGYKFGDLLNIEYKKGLNCGDRQTVDYLRSLLDAKILEFDTEIIGPLIEKLKKLGLYDKTIIIVASDHGDDFCDHGVIGHGATAYDGEIHVPLIVRFPWGKGGKRIRDLTLTIDLVPTLLDSLRIDVPRHVQGKSLTPAIDTQGSAPVREAVMAKYPPGLLTFRDKKWKLVVDRQGNRQLFHLPSDPAEKNNVFDDHSAVGKNIERSLRDWSKSLPSYGIEQDWLPFIDEYTQEKIRETGYW